MLQQFTWQHFLVAALVLSLIWYGWVWLTFYRHRNKGSQVKDRLGQTSIDLLAEEQENELVLVEEEDLIGKPKLPEGMTLVGTQDVRFVGDGGKSDQIGLVPDLLVDLKLLFQKIAERDGSKADFFRMLAAIKSAYPKMSGHPQLAAVNEFIIDHAPFHLTKEDIENLWY